MVLCIKMRIFKKQEKRENLILFKPFYIHIYIYTYIIFIIYIYFYLFHFDSIISLLKITFSNGSGEHEKKSVEVSHIKSFSAKQTYISYIIEHIDLELFWSECNVKKKNIFFVNLKCLKSFFLKKCF